MGNDVFANGMEVSCKAADGKSIACFPDVCFTPPQTPATPPGVPIPYPNTAFAKDTTKGSRTVKISRKEVMLRNKSHFKTSTGDEAGCAPKKGVMTSKIKGKAYFTRWSMDVKVEGKNVVRNLDMTTHNHGSFPSNTGPWPYVDTAAFAPGSACDKNIQDEKDACQGFKPYGDKDPCPPSPNGKPSTDPEALQYASEVIADRDGAGKCLKARRCKLQPYSKTAKGKGGCCDGQTGHHLIEASAFHTVGRGGSGSRPLFGCSRYNQAQAPSICAEGTGHGVGTHGLLHTFQSAKAMKCEPKVLWSPPVPVTERATTVRQAQKDGASAVSDTFPESNCDEECIEAQLAAYHEHQCKMTDPTPIKAVTTCKPDASRLAAARQTVAQRAGGSAI